MKRARAKSIYAFLSASTIWPIVEAARAGNWEAAMALGGVVAGLGSNLLAERIQTWKDKVDAAQKIEQEVIKNPALRNEIDLVLEKLDSISLAHSTLPEPDRNWFLKTLQEELSKLGSLSKFEATLRSIVSSGAIQQSILVTGDNNSVSYILNKYFDHGDFEAKQGDLRNQISNYLFWMCDRCGKIELRGIKREGQQVVQLALEDVYVPLEAEAYDPFTESTKLPSHQGQLTSRTIDLNQVLQLGKRIIITGGPGCGKTTVLIYIAWILSQAIAQDNPGLAQKKLTLKGSLPLPLFVPLSAYATFVREAKGHTDPRQRTLASFISYYLIERQTNFDLPRDFFQQLLRTGQSVILLLDGLDEVPNEDERAQVRQAIEELVIGRENMYVVATCRTAAYKGRSALGKGFREVRVKPLTENQVATLVKQAYQHIYRHDSILRQNKIEELMQGIQKLEAQRRERLGKEAEPLVTSPLIVRMLLVVHFSERQLPDQRAELYMKAADVMLLPEYGPDETIASQIGKLVGSKEMHRELAQHVAFAMHCKGDAQGREIHEDDLRQVLSANSSFKGLIDDFISVTRLRGTLLEERLRMYRFI
ncbi:MAG TPA: NACHT domain-containing protein, partial [bacterium]